MRFNYVLWFVALSMSQLFASTSAADEGQFGSYREAMAAGATLYNGGKLKESRGPLEAAAKLATEAADKCRVHQALVNVYAELGEFELMYASADFVIENATYPAMASLTCRSLLGNIHKKGQIDAGRQRYEQRLEKNAKDRTALYFLSQFHFTIGREYEKRAEYLQRTLDLDKEDGKERDLKTTEDLAFAFFLARQNVKSAELYEELAPLIKDSTSWNFKQAAQAWLRAKELEKALAAAREADKLGPDKRSQSSLDKWHAELGEVFLATKQRDPAVKHYEQALEATSADVYRKEYTDKLEQARRLP